MNANTNAPELSGENRPRQTNGRFTPGQSGNPAGRPKGSSTFTPILRERLDEIDPETGKTNGEKLVDVALRQALKGDYRFFAAIIERVEGRVAEKVKFEAPQSPLDRFSDDQLRDMARKFVFGEETGA